MSFLSPLWGLALASLGVILALYLLKRRYQDYPVASTFLWEKALRDTAASHPFQKLRKNPLLPLQLLLAAALAFSLMRPVLGGGQGGDTVLIFDLSASMQASDGGQTRLQKAAAEARGLIAGLKREDQVTILAAGQQTRQLLSRSDDREAAYRVLNGLQAENGGGDLEAALSLAWAMEKELGSLQIVVFSDDYEAPDGVTVRNAETGLANAAVLSFQAEGSTGYARIANYGPEVQLTLSCYAGETLCDAKTLSIPAGETAGASFALPEKYPYAYVEIREKDAIPGDNRAYFVPRLQKQYTVALLGTDSVFLERALALREDVRLIRAEAGDENVQADLYVQGPSPLIFSLDRDTAIQAGETQLAKGQLTAADASLAQLAFTGVAVKQFCPLTAENGKTLLTLDGQAAAVDTGRAIALGFDIHDTNLPLKYDFPLLMQAILARLLPTSAADVGQGVCGETVSIALPGDAESAHVTLPDGQICAAPQDAWAQNAWAFAQTGAPGLYTLTIQGGASAGTRYFALQIPQTESDVRAVAPSQNGAGAGQSVVGGIELTSWLLALALALLMIEWGVSRRVD